MRFAHNGLQQASPKKVNSFKFVLVGADSCIYVDTNKLAFLPRTRNKMKRRLPQDGVCAYGCGTPVVTCRGGNVVANLRGIQNARTGGELLRGFMLDSAESEGFRRMRRKAETVPDTNTLGIDDEDATLLSGPTHPFRFLPTYAYGRRITPVIYDD